MSAWVIAAALAALVLSSLLFILFDETLTNVYSGFLTSGASKYLTQEDLDTFSILYNVWAWIMIAVLGIVVIWAFNESQKERGYI